MPNRDIAMMPNRTLAGLSGDPSQNAVQAHRLAIVCSALHLVICAILAVVTDTFPLWLVVGVPALLVPMLVALRHPASLLSRLAMAAGFMAFTALTIQQSGGEIEAHFSFFVMMSVLVVYHDWRPLVLAASLILLHHIGFTVLQEIHPGFTIWTDTTTAWLHILVHAGAVVSQTAALCYLAAILNQRFALETENAILSTSLHHASDEANRDALTGLHNRRHLAAVTRSLQPMISGGREMATLCSIDIDHFKRVNDRFGHPVGDEVLRVVAGLLDASVGPTDSAVRYGGEEFLLLLRSCSPTRAAAIAEALRARIAESAVVTTGGPVEVTISIGIAGWTEQDSFPAVYARADEALYAAKRGGRNRVVTAGLAEQRNAA